MNAPLTVAIRDEGGTAVISLIGGVQIDQPELLRDELMDLLERGRTRLVVDLAQLQFIGSAGIAALLDAQHRAKELGGELRLAAPCQRIANMLRIARVDRVFRIDADVAAACEAIAARPEQRRDSE